MTTRFLGVDLAAQPKNTGVVLLTPTGERRWQAAELLGETTDDGLVEAAGRADVVGVDCPLGWPTGFVAAVVAHERLAPWPGGVDRRELTHE